MNFLSLDLEMNQPSRKVIQVGIAVGNIEDGVMLFKRWYLDPEEPLSEYITQLTGITEDDIQEKSVSYGTLASELGEMITMHNTFVNPVTWGCGDVSTLQKEFQIRGINFPFFGRRELDVKQVCVFNALVTKKKPNGGLSSYMGRYKLPFIGTAHRADVDAYNTLRFFFLLMKQQREINNAIASIKEIK